MLNKIRNYIFDQKTTVLFILLCIGGIMASGQSFSFVLDEILTRMGRNAFLVLALLIPIQAGMGLNFAIVIGAMAAQISVFFIVHWGFSGMPGLLLAALMATPIAMLFGYMTGRLFNKMKGSEMIGGLILGYFADGLYQLFFLFIIGTLIPISNPKLIISSGIGVKNTIDLVGNLKYAMDDVLRMTVLDVTTIVVAIAALYTLYKLIRHHRGALRPSVNKGIVPALIQLAVVAVVYCLTFIPAVERLLLGMRILDILTVAAGAAAAIILYRLIRTLQDKNAVKLCVRLVVIAVVYALTFIPYMESLLLHARIPAFTYAAIALLFVFNGRFMSTVMGQNMRTVGQDRGVANASGVNVERTRIIAMIMSTVFASWGQLIYLQNMGTLQTYGAHYQVGTYTIAALLVGGASVHKASSKQAILGVILFHTLFIVSPLAGKNLFGNAGIGEYFRVFVSYGVIALSLALHAWKRVKKKTPLAES